MRKAAATVAPATVFSGCANNAGEDGLDTLYVETDLDHLDTEVDGHDIYVNLVAYSEDEDLEDLALEYREPGEEVWNVLDRDQANEDRAQISESFTTDRKGTYEFRSVASTSKQEYFSDVEEVIFE